MKSFVIVATLLWLSVCALAVPVFADDRDAKIEALEALLQTYLKENQALKSKITELEETPAQTAAVVATTCANDPTKCEDAVLCPLTVTFTGNGYVWSTQAAWTKYVQEAKQRGLNCPALANEDRQENFATWKCDTDVNQCGDADLCQLATYGTNTKVWKSGASQKFVDEAKGRGLACGVVDATQAPAQTAAVAATTCPNDPTKCVDNDLCWLATYGSPLVWKETPVGQKYVNEARKRNLQCGVVAEENCPATGIWDNCFGAFTYANGDKYVGEYKDDKRNGQGTYTFADGTVQEGIWENDEFKYAKKADIPDQATNGSALLLADEKNEKADAAAKAAEQKQLALAQGGKTRDQLQIYAQCNVPGRVIKLIVEEPSLGQMEQILFSGDNLRITNNLISIGLEIEKKVKSFSIDEKNQYEEMVKIWENSWTTLAQNYYAFLGSFSVVSDMCSEYKLLGKL